jgi:amidophosphoribosyltransferase
VSAADFDAIATQRKSQGEEDDGPDRSRLALQSVVHDGR